MKHFFSCDWGTSSFRLRLVSWPWLAIVGEVKTDDGVRQVAERCRGCSTDQGFADVLRRHQRAMIREHQVDESHAPVVISGMASSSIGWRELPYAEVPFRLDGSDLRAESLPGDNAIWLLSGLRTETDVMRGEETELLGMFAQSRWREYADDCVVVMAGTHAKHVRIEGGRITDFRTFMTGELYDVLGKHTILRHSLPETAVSWCGEDEEAFREGVVMAGREPLSQALFGIRTSSLFGKRSESRNAAYLSGLLIGLEVHDLHDRQPESPVLVAAGSHQFSAYEMAFATLAEAAPPVLIPGDVVDGASIRGQAVFLKHCRGEDA